MQNLDYDYHTWLDAFLAVDDASTAYKNGDIDIYEVTELEENLSEIENNLGEDTVQMFFRKVMRDFFGG